MRIILFGIALSAATLTASSSFAAWAVCAPGYKADPKIINGSEDHGQSYTCTGAKAAPQLVCSTQFTALPSGSANMSSMTPKDEPTAYTCAEPTTPSK